MDKQELIKKIKHLVKENKTEEALKLLSQAQLSELDKVVLSLSNRYKRAKEDWMLDNISREDSDRTLNKINTVLLELSDKVESNFHEVKNIEEVEPKKIIDAKSVNSNKEFRPSAKKENKNKKLTLFLIPVIIVAVFISRTISNKDTNIDAAFNEIKSVDEKNKAITPEYLKQESRLWDNFQILYREDFTNRKKTDFRSDIWNLKENKDYWAGLEKNKWYAFKIKKSKFSRHKYLGNIPYNAQRESIPFSVKIIFSEESKCGSIQNCIGRGLTFKYNKKKKSAYSFTINDDGEIKFIKHYNVFQPEKGKSLFKTKVDIRKNHSYQLGIIPYKNEFYLFFDKRFLTTVKDENLNGDLYGVYANGQGIHLFDNVTIFKPID